MSEEVAKIPNLEIKRLLFVYENSTEKKTETLSNIINLIKADSLFLVTLGMAPFLQQLVDEKRITVDSSAVKELSKANQEELKKLEDKLEDAEKNLGETDISDALIAIAHHFAKIGDKEKALTAYRVAHEKTVPLGSRIDLIFGTIRVGFFFNDNDVVSRNIEKVKSLIDEGGDWDRRNRLKVYEGLFLISKRDFAGGVQLLLDSLATFTCTEIMPYKDFVRYAVLSAALVLKRPELKKNVIDSPEILEVLHEIPHLGTFVNSLYNCNYSDFFTSLAAIEQDMKLDDVLSAHYRYYVREMRIIAYAQLLESYQSVSINSMATCFGVSQDFIDEDVCKFIASGRLNAVIDKVGGVVETNRPDAKNAQYQAAIKQGDLLLNRIQKLGRVINV